MTQELIASQDAATIQQAADQLYGILHATESGTAPTGDTTPVEDGQVLAPAPLTEQVAALAEHFGTEVKPPRAPKTKGGGRAIASLLTSRRNEKPAEEKSVYIPKTEVHVSSASKSPIGKKLSWSAAARVESDKYGVFNSIAAAELYIVTHPRDKNDEPDRFEGGLHEANLVRMWSDRSIEQMDRELRDRKNYTPNCFRDIGEVVWLRVLSDKDLAKEISKIDAFYTFYYIKDGVEHHLRDETWRAEILARINEALNTRAQLVESLLNWQKVKQADGTWTQEEQDDMVRGIWEVEPDFSDIHMYYVQPPAPRVYAKPKANNRR